MNPSAETNSIKLVALRATVAALAIATMFFAYADSSMAQGKRGLGGSDNPLITGINANWYYNWGLGINGDIAHAEFVPMFWSGGNVNSGNIQNIINNSPSQYVLGFNEPERANQSNMTVAWALDRWALLQPLRANGFKLVSPAPSDTADGRDWLDEFMEGVDADPNLEVDEVAFHWYGTVNPSNPIGSANSFLNKVDQYHNNYGRPVWITEFAGIDWGNNHDTATMQEANRIFLERVITGLENRSHVTRYAWWNHNNDSRLLTTNTDLPTVTGEAWIDTIADGGEQINILGQSQGNDVFYLRGGELTNTGSFVPQAIRYLDAPQGDSVISGTSDYGFQLDDPGYLRIRSGATLRKQGNNTITLPGTPVTNEGTLLIENGTLQLESGAEIAGQGTMLIGSNGTLATSTDAIDGEVVIGLPTTTLNQGLLHVKDGLASLAGELNLFSLSEIRTDGNLVISGSTTGNGAILSTGPGTLFLTGIGSQTLGAAIPDGSLIVANTNASATGAGDVVVSGSGLLGGAGLIDGNVSATGGTVAPGVVESVSGSTTPPPSFSSGVVVDAIDFDFTGVQDDAPLTQTSTLSNVLQIVSGLDFGPGLNPRNNNNAGNEFNIAGFTTNVNWSGASSDNDYLTFTIAPVEGLAVKIQDVSFELRRNGANAPRAYRIFTSIDGFGAWNDGLVPLNFILDEADTSKKTFTAAYTGNESVAEPIEVRLYGWNSGSTSGNTRVTNVSVDASFVSDPNSVAFDPTGILELGGDYTQASFASLEIDLGGTQAGEFDQLLVDGNAALSGTLDVSLIDGFDGANGQSIDIITANSVTGTFDNVIAPADMNVQVNYSASVVSLQVTDDFLLGDVNLDGVVDFLDIAPFINVLSQAIVQDEADTTQDGVVNFLDIFPFITILSTQ